jgi:hypothetical protein
VELAWGEIGHHVHSNYEKTTSEDTLLDGTSKHESTFKIEMRVHMCVEKKIRSKSWSIFLRYCALF